MIKPVVLLTTIIALGISVEVFAEFPSDGDIKDGGPPDLLDEFDETDRAAYGQAYSSAGAAGPLRPPPGTGPAPGLAPGPGLVRLVECFVCTDCPKTQMNTTTKMCPYTTDSSKNNKCVVYSEKYRHMKHPWYIRGCASERGSCSEITTAHSLHNDIVRLDFCQECEGDRCNINAVSRSLPSLPAFFVLIVFPVFAKHTLS